MLMMVSFPWMLFPILLNSACNDASDSWLIVVISTSWCFSMVLLTMYVVVSRIELDDDELSIAVLFRPLSWTPWRPVLMYINMCNVWGSFYLRNGGLWCSWNSNPSIVSKASMHSIHTYDWCLLWQWIIIALCVLNDTWHLFPLFDWCAHILRVNSILAHSVSMWYVKCSSLMNCMSWYGHICSIVVLQPLELVSMPWLLRIALACLHYTPLLVFSCDLILTSAILTFVRLHFNYLALSLMFSHTHSSLCWLA